MQIFCFIKMENGVFNNYWTDATNLAITCSAQTENKAAKNVI